MPSAQLQLFEPHKPLAQRIGPEFFRAAPADPGVYVMTGKDERVLYIGQSKNLRSRLGSYKNACAGRTSRKTLRLVYEVEKITYETCLTAEAARVRENELLRTHRPRFNRVNTYPRAYTFIYLRSLGSGIEIGRTTEQREDADLYGAFKAMALVGYAALARVLWWMATRSANRADGPEFPLGMMAANGPRAIAFVHVEGDVAKHTRKFLLGESCALLEIAAERLAAIVELPGFYRAFLETQLAALKHFFGVGPLRSLRLRRKFGIERTFLGQEELDDLTASEHRRK